MRHASLTIRPRDLGRLFVAEMQSCLGFTSSFLDLGIQNLSFLHPSCSSWPSRGHQGVGPLHHLDRRLVAPARPRQRSRAALPRLRQVRMDMDGWTAPFTLLDWIGFDPEIVGFSP